MLGLLLTLLSTLDVPTPAAAATLAPPTWISALPPAYLGNATTPGACTGPLPVDGWGVVARTSEPPTLIVRLTDDPRAGRVGGCGTPWTTALHKLSAPPDLRLIATLTPLTASSIAGAEPVTDLTTHRCVTRKTLRPYASLTLLGGRLDGFAIELSPSRSIVTARLIDARKSSAKAAPAVVHPLGKVGVRTLEWCDRTDVAEGHCPNPAHGEIRQAVLVGDQLVLTLALGFADICGQDDLIIRAFALPPAVVRSLPAP